MTSRWLDPNLSPNVDAYGANPYDVNEIDEHVDGSRIWATLLFERGKAKGHEEAKEERPSDELLFEDYRDKLQKALDELKKGSTKASMQKLQDVINEG